jgi:hypothetical protein
MYRNKIYLQLYPDTAVLTELIYHSFINNHFDILNQAIFHKKLSETICYTSTSDKLQLMLILIYGTYRNIQYIKALF